MARLRVLSGREVCAILARHGFREVRRRGSHAIMQRRIDGATATVPVPLHRMVRRGTLGHISELSGLPRREFE